jgi:hypothetical protein
MVFSRYGAIGVRAEANRLKSEVSDLGATSRRYQDDFGLHDICRSACDRRNIELDGI